MDEMDSTIIDFYHERHWRTIDTQSGMITACLRTLTSLLTLYQ